MVKKAFNKPERPPRVEGPPLRSCGGDEDRYIAHMCEGILLLVVV